MVNVYRGLRNTQQMTVRLQACQQAFNRCDAVDEAETLLGKERLDLLRAWAVRPSFFALRANVRDGGLAPYDACERSVNTGTDTPLWVSTPGLRLLGVSWAGSDEEKPDIHNPKLWRTLLAQMALTLCSLASPSNMPTLLVSSGKTRPFICKFMWSLGYF